jgi:hypothetical protein
MKIKTLSAVAVVTAALTVPAFAQYRHQHHHVRAASYHGPAYGVGTFRGAYARLPVDEAFFNGDGWVDHSRVGGVDADLRPSD